MAAAADALVDGPRSRPQLRILPRSGRVAGPRRAACLVLVASAAFAGGLLVASLSRADVGAAEPASASRREASIAIVVAPGDTVWELARAHLPDGHSPAAYVAEIVAVNEVDPARLEPGTILSLPRP